MQSYRTQFVAFLVAALLGSMTLASPEQRQEIAAIRKLYAATNSATTLTRTSIEVSDFSAEGGQLDVYKDSRGQVRKLVANLFGESGKAVFEYYLEGDTLRFIYNRNDSYNHHIADEDAGELKVAQSTEQRFYFADGKLIQWLEGRNPAMSPSSPEFKDMERRQLETFQDLRRQLP